MNLTWDLEIMYKGYNDPKYISDFNKAIELISEIKDFENKLDKNNKLSLIEESLKKDEELQVLLSELFSYSSLRTSTNVNDYEAMGEMAKLQIALQDIVSSNVAFNKFLLDL